MSLIRQAHMPGNYELYDQSLNRLGPVICKICWERFKKENPGPLNTVWISSDDRRMVWWLCDGCAQTMEVEGYGSARVLKSSKGFIPSPRLGT